MISIQNLSVEFSAKSLFDNINYVINRRGCRSQRREVWLFRPV